MLDEDRIAGFLGRFAPEIAALAQACRTRLQQLIPRGQELVYDNYNALVFAFGPTPRASDAVLSIALYPRWVTLFFAYGVDLPDPQALLVGSGSRVRSVRLGSVQVLDTAPVLALIEAACAPQAVAFAAAPALATIIKSVSARQRPRRPRPQGAG